MLNVRIERNEWTWIRDRERVDISMNICNAKCNTLYTIFVMPNELHDVWLLIKYYEKIAKLCVYRVKKYIHIILTSFSKNEVKIYT